MGAAIEIVRSLISTIRNAFSTKVFCGYSGMLINNSNAEKE